MSDPHEATRCESCGMPMRTAQDHGMGDINNPRCQYCTKPDGTYRSYAEVFEGTVRALMGWQNLSREEAEKQAHFIDNLPVWRG